MNTEERYASFNVTAYRYFKIFNANTVKDSMNKMQINGKDKQINFGFIKSQPIKIINNLCILKIIQLGDFGLKSDGTTYSALAHHALTNCAYSVIDCDGGYTKLKNYTILNQEHGNIVYYVKMVSIVNMIAITKLLFLLILEKIYE